MELICSVQNYHWGKKGANSLVGKFSEANSGVYSDQNKPYAELWMGTHPNGPSRIKTTKEELSHHLALHPHELGEKVINEFGGTLPFLFKILSVEEPLSIQAHPTKSHARQLFEKFPKIYKDGNHKPELAIALTEFEALCSFRPVGQIKHFLRNVPEFSRLIDEEKMARFCMCDEESEECRKSMKDCFQSLMLCDGEIVASAVGQLIDRCETLTPSQKEEYLVPLVNRIHFVFPKDVGVFCVYWLNYITLSPGEALYLAPNEPHAYLHGDCLECMANSDNVVRAGLTPKFRDIETLCRMLSYKNYQPWEIHFQPETEDRFCVRYCPPVKDFAVAKIALKESTKYNLIKRESGSILVVIGGSGKLNYEKLNFGKVFFLPSMSECCVESESGDLVLYQAYCNI